MLDEIKSDLKELDEQEIKDLSFKQVKGLLKSFNPFSHKGNRGHAAIFAGSHGMMGAAILSTKAAMKSGVGKVSAIVPERYFELIHITTPEALAVKNDGNINYENFNSIAVGPGLGNEILNIELVEKIFTANATLVIDADMINYLSQNPSLIKLIPKNSILTPHLKEWHRLWGNAENDKKRILKTQDICEEYGFYVLIKGHISSLVTPKREVFFNATGNAGMAKAGSGDVLTGLLAGMLAQGYNLTDAGMIGMYIHGYAGDLARELYGENAMTPSDQINLFGTAFGNLVL
jgi:NAD(P)H-hydrate epimerase